MTLTSSKLARIVRGDVSTRDIDCLDCIRVLADKLADVLAKQDPKFDRKKFLKACEPRKDNS